MKRQGWWVWPLALQVAILVAATINGGWASARWTLVGGVLGWGTVWAMLLRANRRRREALED